MLPSDNCAIMADVPGHSVNLRAFSMADQPKQINFTIVPGDDAPDAPAPRTYANFCSIAHTPFDFTLTFCEVMPLSDKEIQQAES